MQIFDECRDGLILCKLINDSVPDTIDFRVLNLPTPKKPLNNFQITENNNIVITSTKAIGCSVVNIGSSDIAEGREHLILGLIWQIIRRGLLNNVDIKIHPELYRLCEDGETIDDLLRLTPDQILLRWFNYHLKAAGWHRTVRNFSKDVSDGENYTVLLNQLKPDECSRAPLQTKDLRQRAEEVLKNAERIGCRKYLTPAALVAGNPRLNLAFVANLFNTWPGLEPLEPGQDFGAVEDFDAEGEREARVFTLWLNSLGVEPGINNLFEDLRVSVASIGSSVCTTDPSLQNGVAILQAFDKISPGCIAWRRVSKPKAGAEAASPTRAEFAEGEEEEETGVTPNMAKLSRFKCVENANYAVDLGKQNGMHLVGIQGADIVDAKKTLVLGLTWQLMRCVSYSLSTSHLTRSLLLHRLNIVKTLTALSGNNRPISDTEILRWANGKVSAHKPGSATVRSFKDSSISTGIWFLNLLDALNPGIVDPSLVQQVDTHGDYELKRQNGACNYCSRITGTDESDDVAKLAISIARKMNALIFLVPEDIVDVRSKLVGVFRCIQYQTANTLSPDPYLCRKSHEPGVVRHMLYAINHPLVCLYYVRLRLLFLYYGCIAVR